MNTQKYAIRDYPSARVLDVVDSREEAKDIIAAWEEQDMIDCVYSPGRYYITPWSDPLTLK